MSYANVLAEINSDTAIADSNADVADVTPTRADNMVRISILLQTSVNVRLVPDTGTQIIINSGSPVPTSIYTQDVPLDPNRTWKLRFSGASTVSYMRVLEVSARSI